MLKQVHQPPSHKQSINFHLTTNKRRQEKIMPLIFSKKISKVHYFPSFDKNQLETSNKIAHLK